MRSAETQLLVRAAVGGSGYSGVFDGKRNKKVVIVWLLSAFVLVSLMINVIKKVVIVLLPSVFV